MPEAVERMTVARLVSDGAKKARTRIEHLDLEIEHLSKELDGLRAERAAAQDFLSEAEIYVSVAARAQEPA